METFLSNKIFFYFYLSLKQSFGFSSNILAIFLLLSGFDFSRKENSWRFTVYWVIRWEAYTVFNQLFQLFCCWIHDVYPFFLRLTHQVGIKKPPIRRFRVSLTGTSVIFFDLTTVIFRFGWWVST